MKLRTQALAAVAALQAAPALALTSERLAAVARITTRLEDRSSVALTFDDGPDPSGTPAVLDALDVAGVPATFFLCGEQVARQPHLAREIVDRGHTVGVHGYRHVLLGLRSPRGTKDDLCRACDEIERAAGVAPRWYRPPYGVANPAALAAAARLGLPTVLWSRWGRDWQRGATPASIASTATRDLRGGEIILLHDSDRYSAPGSWLATATGALLVIDAVRARGFDLVAL